MREGTRGTAVSRRRRMSAAEVRGAMLEAGRRSIWNAGLTLDLNDSHFDDLIRDASVPRSSVFRIWQTKADYLVDLYESVTASGMQDLRESIVDAGTFGSATELLDSRSDLLTSAQGRRALLLEIVRTGVAANLERMSNHPHWHSYAQLMISAPVLLDLPDGDRIAAAQIATERSSFIAAFADRYRALFGSLKLEPKNPALGYEHFTVASVGVVEAFAMRNVLASTVPTADTASPTLKELVVGTVPGPGIDGGEAPWLPVAVAFLGVVDAFFEPAE